MIRQLNQKILGPSTPAWLGGFCSPQKWRANLKVLCLKYMRIGSFQLWCLKIERRWAVAKGLLRLGALYVTSTQAKSTFILVRIAIFGSSSSFLKWQKIWVTGNASRNICLAFDISLQAIRNYSLIALQFDEYIKSCWFVHIFVHIFHLLQACFHLIRLMQYRALD